MGINEIWIIILENNFGEKYFFNIYDRNEGFFFFLKLKIMRIMCFFVVCFNDYLLVLSEFCREYGLCMCFEKKFCEECGYV